MSYLVMVTTIVGSLDDRRLIEQNGRPENENEKGNEIIEKKVELCYSTF